MTEIKSSACFTSGKSQCLTAPCRWNISLKLGITSFFLTLVCLQLVWMNCEIPIKVTESNTLWLTLWLIFGDSPLILCVSLFIHTLISKLSMYHIPARWVTTELEGLRNPDLYHFVPRPWRSPTVLPNNRSDEDRLLNNWTNYQRRLIQHVPIKTNEDKPGLIWHWAAPLNNCDPVGNKTFSGYNFPLPLKCLEETHMYHPTLKKIK